MPTQAPQDLEAPTGLLHDATASVERPRRGRPSLTSRSTQSTYGGKYAQASGILSPATSQATPNETEVRAALASFVQWPLENASLERITENGKTTFQLQRAAGPTVLQLQEPAKYTPQEDDLLIELKKGTVPHSMVWGNLDDGDGGKVPTSSALFKVKMAPRWFEKVESKAKKLLSPLAPSPSPSPTPSQPASESAARPTSQPTPPPPTSTDSETSPLPNLQERLWNQAYDELKASEPKLVEAYEKILSVGLHRKDPSSVTCESTENEIEGARETRCRQMQQLVRYGLDRTQKAASIKRGIDEGLQAVQAVRGIVDKAIQAAPEAAIAWVGVCLGLEILSNPVTEARYNRSGIAYVLSRMEWYWNLVSLLLDENKAEQSSAGLRVQLEKHVVQLYEKLLSYQVKSVCLYHRNWATVILRDVFRLDDWAGQLDDIQKAEAAVRTDSDQYNTEQSKIYLQKLTDTASALEMNLQGIHSAIKDQTRQQEKRYQDAKCEKCMQDLHVTDPSKDKKRIQDTKGGLLRDSYRWILDHAKFQQFRDDPQSRLLWIKGDPGKGKTMLLCGIIDELEEGSNCLLSYFFCQATETQLSNAASVLRGLIYLLIIQQPSLISYLRSKHDVTGEKLFQGINVWVSLVEILTDMLKDPTLKDVVLVVDALDECITDRPQLIDFIIQSSSTPSPRVKWIISSRNWPDIEDKLDSVKQKVRLPLELNKDSISKAVNTYIGYRVDRLASHKKYDKQTRDAVENYLTSNADGTFLWVALVCQELADPNVRKRHTLNTLKSIPPGLDSLYDRMIGHIGDSKDAGLCKEVLAIASVVYRPITLDELKVLIESLEDLDQDDLEEIIRSCGSFLTLQEGVIYFVHQSAKDFLLNKASNQILPSGAARQHHAIFSRSLEALSETLERDVYKLGAPGFPIYQVSPPDPDPLASIRYSCVFWINHLDDSEPWAKMSDKDLQDAEIVHDFLQKKYLYWLESLSLLRSMSEGVIAVQKLEALVKSKEAQQLIELLQDARRFILSHKRATEIAPLQVYASALVFSPTRSLIRGLFEKEEPNWITLKPTVESDWNACLQTLEGHDSSVNSVAFSADGQRLASGSGDKTVKIWDTATGACLQTLEGHDNSVSSVAFSADGQRLASGSFDKTVKIWDAATGTYVQTLEGHNDLVISVAFLADSQRLASGSVDKTVKIWDAATGTCLQMLEGHNNSVNSVAFSADSQRLASGSADKTVRIWDAAKGACVQTLKVGGVITHLSFDPTTSSLLSTDIGLLNLDLTTLPSAIDNASTDAALQSVRHSGWGISTDSVWIVKDGKRMLWLPPEYRVMKSAVVGPTVAIGCRSGRVLVMKFS
ncbi:nwd1 protein [Fusarium austroafricanum]|uniref:Nwd1 protein n=1 Tax=Fusarium austroafricanum TaxID=2364996 RepID=A0A8H4KE93_9HYPO|nr:nwd1 protein [Fusarium austroafricanum]